MLFWLHALVDLWALVAMLFGFCARTDVVRATMPRLTTAYYRHLPWAASFFPVFTLLVAPKYSEMQLCFLASVTCFAFCLVDYFDADKPDYIPLGIKFWAHLSPAVPPRDQFGLVDSDILAERTKQAASAPMSTAQAKAERYRAEVDARKLAVAKEYQDAQTALARAAREYNEAKLRAEEAKRRSHDLGR